MVCRVCPGVPAGPWGGRVPGAGSSAGEAQGGPGVPAGGHVPDGYPRAAGVGQSERVQGPPGPRGTEVIVLLCRAPEPSSYAAQLVLRRPLGGSHRALPLLLAQVLSAMSQPHCTVHIELCKDEFCTVPAFHHICS